ncbi:polar amino acid transport system substrate-binding protein [Crossiella equi]|uniref:Polar amino acid transport system substrate-binding protein n=1 Tax=Crossiella equi TaxID=130796 RepID=A0ABS5AGD4_9PSEU|nr:transporter substrate-binding domain-containing protein [Crossiella equi]MBP2475635.1 polar amino acid transport system substrate-binding protein [Crossiella equi]
MARRTRHQVLALLPVAALLLAATACGGGGGGTTVNGVPLAEAGKLKTCTHLPYEPFQFKDGDKVVGFDVDLVNLVAKDLGVTQEIVDGPFDTIASGQDLNINKCDVAAAGMTITDTRKQNMDFSDSYFLATQALLVKKGSGLTSLESLKGKKLGVQADTTGKVYAEKNAAGAELVTFEDLGLLLESVKNGSIAAAINDDFVLKDYARKNADTEMTSAFDTNENYGIGIRKGNEALLKKVNEVLAKAKSDGTYATLYEKWFKEKPKQG